jgi:hypothetical protein
VEVIDVRPIYLHRSYVPQIEADCDGDFPCPAAPW